ncbi:MAG: carbon monoxide dehydrogenase subunit G [Acidobacteriota bacterium]|nr:carbon monoxide dehydrogenase subunit G [Acidobacteriota bacterium]
MKIQGEHHFDAPREEVWKALLDPDVLGATVPGSQGLERSGDNEYQGKLKIKIGPVQGVFQGKVKLTDLDPPNGYDLKIEGRGPAGFMNGTGKLGLGAADSGTNMRYDIDAKVGGRIAGVGQRLLDSSAKVITRQALEALDAQVVARAGAGPTDSAETETEPVASDAEAATQPPASAPPTQAEFAAGVAKGVAAELIPAPYRRLVTMAAIGIVAAIFVLFIRECAG